MFKTTRRFASFLCAASLLAAPALAEPWISEGQVGDAEGYRLTEVARGLERPWGMDWLPNGDLLITELGGALRLVRDGRLLRDPVSGLPEVYGGGQGGLLDVAVHPDFQNNGLIYLTFSAGNSQANGTRVARAVLADQALSDLEVIYEAKPLKSGRAHYGSRLLFLPDGTLLVTIGDGGNPPISLDGEYIRLQAQKPKSALGKTLRLTDGGGVPADNPFVDDPLADPALWSLGHRNAQGLARDAQRGIIWSSEFGARGGDELNIILPGNNYGWPLATYSLEYSGGEISPYRSLPGMTDPQMVWMGLASPSGLASYSGGAIEAWSGDLFQAMLRSNDVRRIQLDEAGRVIGEERIPVGARVRDVAEGPDGHLYLITDQADGRLIRIDPAG